MDEALRKLIEAIHIYESNLNSYFLKDDVLQAAIRYVKIVEEEAKKGFER